MRGGYTAGVLTVLNENRIELPVVYGISAGACNALSYISGQDTREYELKFGGYVADPRYVSVENLYRTGSMFGFDFIFGEMFQHLVPFDYEAFFRSPVNLKTGATDLKTGRTVYFDKAELDREFTAIRASSSLPFIANIVSYRGYELLDGGCSTPIPLERSIFDGNTRNIVVLTRDISYRKGPRPEFPRAVLRAKYGDYPNFIDAMMRRPEVYNSELDLCRRQEQEEKALVIRPSSPIVTGRYEKDPEKLKNIYEMGIRDCENQMDAIKRFLSEPDD